MNARLTKTVLLIDDDPVTNIINTKIIKKYFSLKVIVFANASEALHQLQEWSTSTLLEFPDVIFLDINLPEMDGWDFLEEFQKFPTDVHQKCRVIILTSSIDFSDIQKSKTYSSVRDFISKPLTGDKVKLLIS